MSKDEIAQIKYISLGLETYTPFTFDATGIINEKNEILYSGIAPRVQKHPNAHFVRYGAGAPTPHTTERV